LKRYIGDIQHCELTSPLSQNLEVMILSLLPYIQLSHELIDTGDQHIIVNPKLCDYEFLGLLLYMIFNILFEINVELYTFLRHLGVYI